LITLVMVMVILILVLIFPLYFSVKRYVTEKNRLESLHMENADLLKICQTLTQEIEKSLPLAEVRLEKLKGRIPKEQFSFLQNLLNTAKNNLPKRKKWLEIVTSDHLLRWRVDLVSTGVNSILDALRKENNFSEALENKVIELSEAETNSQKLLAEIPKLLTSLAKELSPLDVSKEAKDSLEKARSEFDKAKSLVRDIKTDWLTIFASLSAVEIFLFVAKEKGTLNKKETE